MKLSVVGTGLLGGAVARRFLTQGHRVCVYNRTFSKTNPFIKCGAVAAKDVREAVDFSSVILLFLSDARAINDVMLINRRQIDYRFKTIVQMGTIAPQESKDLERKFKQRGAQYLECPVLGSRGEALEGRLILMASAGLKKRGDLKALLRILGRDIYFFNKTGDAALVKLALNQMIASLAVGYSVSLGLVRDNKNCLNHFVEILRKSALYTPMFDKKFPLWRTSNYKKANFSVKHLLKDVRLILAQAKSSRMDTSVLKAYVRLLENCIQQGYQNLDYSAVYESVNKR